MVQKTNVGRLHRTVCDRENIFIVHIVSHTESKLVVTLIKVQNEKSILISDLRHVNHSRLRNTNPCSTSFFCGNNVLNIL